MTLSSNSGVKLSLDDPNGIAMLGQLFKAARFDEATIEKTLGAGPGSIVLRSEIPLTLRRLPKQGALPTLIRLFLIGIPVETETVARDLIPMTPDHLESLGLVSLVAGTVEPRVCFQPYANLVLASDLHQPDIAALPADYVPGMNPSSASIAALTIRRPAKAMLDLGTGFGVQALYASRHCEHVVATDINARALSFAAFNAALNGVQNVEFREGNLFEPVADDTFDLIVCNPPYVISPENGPLFRDGRASGDSLCRNIVREIPRHLREGGFASVLCNWILRIGQRGSDPLNAWIADSGCDALLLHTATESAFEYAASWNRPLLARRPDEFEKHIDQWLDYFHRLDIQNLGGGGAILRRRNGGTPWIRPENLPLQGDQESGAHFLRMFDAQDWLAGSPDLARSVFIPAGDIRVEQTATFREGAFGIDQIGLSFVRGLKLRAFIDVGMMNVLLSCNGQRTLGDILERLTPSSEPDAAAKHSKIAAGLARLHALGFVMRIPSNPNPNRTSTNVQTAFG